MTAPDKTDREDQDRAKGAQQGKADRLPIVTIRSRASDKKVWPRLLSLRLKDGTPVEDMMLR